MAAATKPEINKSQSIRDYFKKNPTAHAKEVVAALGEKGVTVTESHVYVVKGKLKMKKAAKSKEKAAATASATGTKAKKVEAAVSANGKAQKVKNPPSSAEAPNKSQAIRDLFKQNPQISVEEVVSTLAADGIQVTKSLIYLVKGKMKSKKKGRGKAKKTVAKEMMTATKKTVTTPSSNGSSGDALQTIMQVKGLANDLGGLTKLKALVDALSE